VLAALLATPSLAHDASRPDLGPWFDGLRSARGPCCSVADGTAIADGDWESKGDSYRVRVPRHPYSSEMIWVDIPKDAVITEPNRAGRTMVWPVWVYGSGVWVIRCFMPGSMV